MARGVKVLSLPGKVKAANDSLHSREVLKASMANELFVAVVGPAGSGTGRAAEIIKDLLESSELKGGPYEAHIVKASGVIKRWALANSRSITPGDRKTLQRVREMQDHGDEMRRSTGDNAAVARGIVAEIRIRRAEASGRPEGELDGRRRAYIIESLRNPAEAHLLRRLYQDAFSLVGVVCSPEERDRRLRSQLYDFRDMGKPDVKAQVAKFMERDADAPEKHGQHVTDTFHESDFFVDNSRNAKDDPSSTAMNDPLRRFVELITSQRPQRPTVAETAMHQALSSQLRSACLSRQVGAALVDETGNVIATGTNEAPRAGGGVYGESFEVEVDHRCAFREKKFCSNNKMQNDIIAELLTAYPVLLEGRDEKEVMSELRRTRIGGLIEFSRAVHAEMDAILSAARVGVSPQGCRLFVSTFPCHYCARHIVTAGIDEVQYIEPYPKSQALRLHCDAITETVEDWLPPSVLRRTSVEHPASETKPPPRQPQVLFRPFVGVAPRMYARVFMKDRDYKDKLTGEIAIGEPDWGGPTDMLKVRYTELEGVLGLPVP